MFSSFKPTFTASEISKFCSPNLPEKTIFNLLIKNQPFIQYKQNLFKLEAPVKSISVPVVDKAQIKEVWENNFQNGNLNFNDTKVFNKVLQVYYTEKKPTLNETDTKDLDPKKLSFLMRNIRFERGKQMQQLILEKINKEEKTNFVVCNKNNIIELENYFLSGRPDGIDKESNSVIEIKTRSISIKTIALNDRIQCMAYLKLTNCDKCYLVMSDPASFHSIFKFRFDPSEFETEISQKINHFVHKCRNLSKSEFVKMARKYNGYY